MYRTLIWATDGSVGADAALEEALALRELAEARLIAVHCDHRLGGRSAAYPALADDEDVREAIRRQVDELRGRGLPVELIVRHSHREAADVVAEIAREQDADAIVCGTRGLGAFAGAFLGSFTQRLLHVAPCAVVAVPTRERSETERPLAGTHAPG